MTMIMMRYDDDDDEPTRDVGEHPSHVTQIMMWLDCHGNTLDTLNDVQHFATCQSVALLPFELFLTHSKNSEVIRILMRFYKKAVDIANFKFPIAFKTSNTMCLFIN